MEAIAFVIIVVLAMASLAAVDLLALHFGADSRTSIGDDHARSAGS